MDNIETSSYDDTFTRIEDIIISFDDAIKKTKEIYLKGIEIDLPNIAVQYNNKLIEIMHIYEEKGLNFFTSELYYPISTCFLNLINKGLSCLEFCIGYLEKERQKITFLMRLRSIMDVCNEKISEYNQIDSLIYNFDIEKGINEVVKSYIVTSNRLCDIFKQPRILEERPDLIDKFNKELEILGYDVIIDNDIVYEEQNDYSKVYDRKKLKMIAKKYKKK